LDQHPNLFQVTLKTLEFLFETLFLIFIKFDIIMLSEKGKYASATENRRFVWKEIVWPLIIEVNDAEFTLLQYQKKRDEICEKYGILNNSLSRGLASLIQRGLLYKERQSYFIHFRLIPYMRLKAEVDYGTALHEIKIR